MVRRSQLDRTPSADAVPSVLHSRSAIWPNGPHCAPDEAILIDAGYRLFAPLANGDQIRKHIRVECRVNGAEERRLAFSALTPLGEVILQDIAEQVEALI
jgi:hypothetical protein